MSSYFTPNFYMLKDVHFAMMDTKHTIQFIFRKAHTVQIIFSIVIQHLSFIFSKTHTVHEVIYKIDTFNH